METCYKAVRTRLLQSIPIRSGDFRIEPELTIKLAKRGARIFEVPISYAGRTYEEGKKIGFKTRCCAFATMVHWWLIDDLYNAGRVRLEHPRPPVGRAELQPLDGRRGAAVRRRARARDRRRPRQPDARRCCRATATRSSDVNPHYLDYLRNFADGKPYLDVRRVDLVEPGGLRRARRPYDTVICLNVLEHVADEARALAQPARRARRRAGARSSWCRRTRRLYGTLDEVLGHERRYTRESLRGGAARRRLRGRARLRLQPRHDAGVVVQRPGAAAAATSARRSSRW